MEIKFGTIYKDHQGRTMIILDPGENGHFEAALVTENGAIHGIGTLDKDDIHTLLSQIELRHVIKGRRIYFKTEIKHPMPKSQIEILKELSTRKPQTI